MNRYLFSLLLVSCAPKDLAVSLETLASQPPGLPSPVAEVYARGAGKVPDAAVAELAKALHWDEALSGAAGSLAMAVASGEEASPWGARWAAYRAGYPHNLIDLRVYRGGVGQIPPELDTDLDSVDVRLDIGLARARGYEFDTWVLMTARVDVGIEPFPRVLSVGETITLEVGEPAGVDVQWVSPSGLLDRVSLVEHSEFTLGEEGEWWLQLLRPTAPVRRSSTKPGDPVYYMMSVPVMVGFESPDVAPMVDWDATDGVLSGVTALREEFDVAPPTVDPILESVARARARGLADPNVLDSAAWLPPVGQCGGVLVCNALSETIDADESGLRGCFERWLIDGVSRSTLVDERCDLIGVSKVEAVGARYTFVVLGQSEG